MIATLVCVGLLLAVWIDRQPKGRGSVKREIPSMAVRRDDPGREDGGLSATPAEFATLVCTVDTDGDPGMLRAREADGTEAAGTVNGNDLVLQLEPGTWTVTWVAPGRAYARRFRTLGTLSVDAGDVRSCQLTLAGLVFRGNLVDEEGRPAPEARVEGCGARVEVGSDGRFEGVLRPNARGPCVVRAAWRDGQLVRFGEEVQVDPFAVGGGVELAVDTSPVAGLGVGFRMSEEGALVDRVIEGSPAWVAGLEVGDLITRVDGEDVAGLGTYEFVELATGPEGSTARITVRFEDEVEELSFRRERLAERE